MVLAKGEMQQTIDCYKVKLKFLPIFSSAFLVNLTFSQRLITALIAEPNTEQNPAFIPDNFPQAMLPVLVNLPESQKYLITINKPTNNLNHL